MDSGIIWELSQVLVLETCAKFDFGLVLYMYLKKWSVNRVIIVTNMLLSKDLLEVYATELLSESKKVLKERHRTKPYIGAGFRGMFISTWGSSSWCLLCNKKLHLICSMECTNDVNLFLQFRSLYFAHTVWVVLWWEACFISLIEHDCLTPSTCSWKVFGSEILLEGPAVLFKLTDQKVQFSSCNLALFSLVNSRDAYIRRSFVFVMESKTQCIIMTGWRGISLWADPQLQIGHRA